MDLVEPVTDDELTALALAADPDPVISDDATSLWDAGRSGAGLLPEWYMPSPMAGARLSGGWRRRVVVLIIVSFLAIAASGLCSTYGQIVLA